MGSKSDLPVMQDAIEILKEFGIESEVNIVSAHRTPDKMFKYASSAKNSGIKVIIAGAGGAAHLPGMVASITTLPVIGVPVKSRNSIDGWDSVLSILQKPSGVPVATVALNGAKKITIFPYFLAIGLHVAEDIPEEIDKAKKRYPNIDFVMLPHLGKTKEMADLILKQISI